MLQRISVHQNLLQPLKAPVIRHLLYFILLLLQIPAVAQPVYRMDNHSVPGIENMSILPDHGYPFERIRTDTTLPFVRNDSLRPRDATGYWLRLIVDNPFPEVRSYHVKVFPNLDNTLYYYDANAGKWESSRAGILTKSPHRGIGWGSLSCVLRAQTKNVLYVKVEVQKVGLSGYSPAPQVIFEEETVANRQMLLIWTTWIASLTALLFFFLNSIYIYFRFRDKTVLYFILVQAGGLIFITAYKQVFNLFFSCPVFSIGVLDGFIVWFDLNSLLLHFSILILMYGIVRFTRSYLDTRHSFPRLDPMLRYGLHAYLLLSFLFTLSNTGWYIENYTWIFDNSCTGLFIAVIMYISIAGYRRKLPASGAFLAANLLSFAFMMATSLFHLIMSMNHTGYSPVKTFLPDLAIITQTLGISIALITRARVLQNNLATKETEILRMEFELRELELRHRLITQENQTIGREALNQKTHNEELQQKLEANQRELASITLYMAQKNELLARLKTQIKEVKKQSPEHRHMQLEDIESLLQSHLHLDDEWNRFKLHFEQVHPGFFEELKVKHPTLTKNETRLCAYFHLHLSTKEIATLLNIDPASVRRAKSRLYKKIGLRDISQSGEEKENGSTFL